MNHMTSSNASHWSNDDHMTNSAISHWSREDQAPLDGIEQDYDDDSDVAGNSCCCRCCCSGGCCQCHSCSISCRELDVHGLRRVWPPRSTNHHTKSKGSLRRVLWLTLILTMLGAFVYSTVERILYYMSHPQLTQHWETVEASNNLPPLTLCNINPLRLTEIAKRKWPTSTSRPISALSGNQEMEEGFKSWSKLNISSRDVFTSAGSRLDKFILGCSSAGKICSRQNFSKTLLDAGVCYTIIPEASRLTLYVNTESYDHTELHSVEPDVFGVRLIPGPEVVKHHKDDRNDPREAYGTVSTQSGVILQPGRRFHVVLQQTDVTLTPTTSKSCSDSYQSRDYCLAQCQEMLIENICRCRPFWVSKDITHKTCSMKEHINCVQSILDNPDSLSPPNCTCPFPCKYREFSYTVSDNPLLNSFLLWSFVDPLTASMEPFPGLPSFLSQTQLNEMNDDRCSGVGNLHRVSPELFQWDSRLFTSVDMAVEKLHRNLDRTQTEIRQTAHELHATLAELYPRVSFHVTVGLEGLLRSFRAGFASAFEKVRVRSLDPLVSNYHETLAAMERALKQLSFSSAPDVISRKVLYFMTDNQLSARLETAILALDNVTKVYYSFVEAKPLEKFEITPMGRYDQHLIPEEILHGLKGPMKEYHTELSVNIAGLVGDIVKLKEILQQVFQSSGFNDTAFKLTRQTYINRTVNVDIYAKLFYSRIIEKCTRTIEEKITDILKLNRSLSDESHIIYQKFAQITNILNTRYDEAYRGVRKFTQLAQSYTRDPKRTDKLSVSSLGLDSTTNIAFQNFKHSLDDATNISTALRNNWNSLEGAVKSIWNEILEDDWLKNFYLNLYNDVTDLQNKASRSTEALRAIFIHEKMLNITSFYSTFGEQRSERGSVVGEGPGGAEFLRLMNADQPVTSKIIKMANITDQFSTFRRGTDLNAVLSADLQRLISAYDDVINNLKQFRQHCVINKELISENVITIDISISQVVKHRKDQPIISLITLLGQIGGLAALFLGASIITIFELVDVALCGWTCSTSSSSIPLPQYSPASTGPATTNKRGRGSGNSNHVTFKSVDGLMSPDGSLTKTSLVMTSLSASFQNQHNNSPMRFSTPAPALKTDVPKIRIDQSYRSRHRQHQEETDI